MEAKDVNLNEIHKLPESEFRKHFTQWVEEDGVARALQAKLRKDLIETFNRTHLGRRIYAMYSKANRMILSPLILALNTLVAEFLYAQNCHFSLSVFSTEVPYRNTLPDFESETPFRFTKSDIMEIFEAISTNISEDFQQTIIQCYLNESTPKYCISLLYLIFKHVFKFSPASSVHRKTDAKTHQAESARTETSRDKSDSESSKGKDCQSSEATSKKQFGARYNNQFRYLNKYLVILSRKVKEMSISLEQLEGREVIADRLRRKSVQTRKMENLNRSLEKISENLRILSQSKRKNRKMSVIISAIDKLTMQLEKCSQNFQVMSRNLREGPATTTDKSTSAAEKSYGDWVRELTSTKSGKKFVAKIEIALRKTLEEEKDKLSHAFNQKFENHKALLKLKYKQKLLQRLETRAPPEANQTDKSNEIQNYIERKLEELNKKHDDLLKKIQESEARMKDSEVVFSLDDERSKQKPASARRKLFKEMIPTGNQLSSEEDKESIPPRRAKPVETTIDLKPQLEEMAKSIAEQERNIDHIIYGAKLRIQELEYESNQLDRSFQDYIEKQNIQKHQLETNAAHIWNNYNLQKSLLDSRQVKRRIRSKQPKTEQTGSLPSDDQISRSPPPAVPSSDDFAKIEKPCVITSPHFENPFRKLKTEILVKESWKLGNRITSDPNEVITKPHDYADASTSPVLVDTETSNMDEVETENKFLQPNIEGDHNQTPVSSELNLKDATLEGIVLSDTKSSERSHSSRKPSLALKVPNVVLTRSAPSVKDTSSQLSESDSLSKKLEFSTGKQGSSDENFWD